MNGEGVVTCIGSDATRGVVQMDVQYAVSDVSNDQLIAYVQWMRDMSGFLVGPVVSAQDIVSGEMWRPSVDAGAVIHITYKIDGTGTVVSVVKDWTGASLSGLRADITPSAPSLGGGPHLTLVPAVGWEQYATWQYPTDYFPGYQAIVFGKIVEGDLVGTLLVVDATFDAAPYPGTIDEFADAWMTDFHPQPPEMDLPSATSTTIGGLPALTCTFTWADAQFRFTYVSSGSRVFAILAVTRPTSVPDPSGDVDAMLASIQISQ